MSRLRARRSSADEDGFTLIELLVVIVILGILAGIAIFAISTFKSRASGGAYDADRRILESAIAGYYAGNDQQYPTDLQQLVDQGYLSNVSISADKVHLVGNGYTITFFPGSPPSLSDKDASLAAGGTPSDGGGGGGGGGGSSPSPSPSASASTAPPSATTMTATLTLGAVQKTCCSGNPVNAWTWSASVTVTVTDNLGAPVSGANVSGSWAGTPSSGQKTAVTADPTCQTGSDGTCAVTASVIEANVTSVAYTLSGVSKTGLTFSGSGSKSATRPW